MHTIGPKSPTPGSRDWIGGGTKAVVHAAPINVLDLIYISACLHACVGIGEFLMHFSVCVLCFKALQYISSSSLPHVTLTEDARHETLTFIPLITKAHSSTLMTSIQGIQARMTGVISP